MGYFVWYWLLTPIFFAAIAWHYHASKPFSHEIKLQSAPPAPKKD